VLEAAEAVKKRLSSDETTSFNGIDITRADLEKIARPWIERTRLHCLRALSDAGIKAATSTKSSSSAAAPACRSCGRLCARTLRP
jgi:molecular chaperone DnaK (HSP70)